MENDGRFASGIFVILVLCEKAKYYCRAKYNIPEASVIPEVKIQKKPGPYYKCRESSSKATAQTVRKATVTKL